MSSRSRVLTSSVGTKLLIGLTGFLLFLYLITHIAGNLIVFFGPDTFNQYSHTLLSNPLIVPIEIGLLVVVLVHVYKTITMFFANRQARPIRYMKKSRAGHTSQKSFASSTMILSGLWLLAFIVIHVRTFKYGAEYQRDGVRDLYRLEFENLNHPLVVGFYVLSMIVVGSHLWHGVSSSLQSLGLDHSRWTPRFLAFGKLMALLIAGGFVAIILWVYANQPGSALR